MRTKRNMFNNNELQTSLIFSVFATNFAVSCKYASYERYFVKKIQHLFSFQTTGWKLKSFPPTWPSWGVLCLFLQRVYVLSDKVSSQQFCSFRTALSFNKGIFCCCKRRRRNPQRNKQKTRKCASDMKKPKNVDVLTKTAKRNALWFFSEFVKSEMLQLCFSLF